MTLRITGLQVHNGFLLSEPSHHLGNLVVLTGKNGCGKTRLLESIQKSFTSVEMDGEQLTNQEIMFLGQDKLIPNLGGEYNDGSFQTKIASTLQVFDQIKTDLDSPFNPEKPANRGHMSPESLPYESLYRLCQSIAGHLHKPASKLTHEEIKIYFEDHVHSILGFQNISTICNRYIKRKKQNRYNRFLAEIEGEDIVFLTDDEFLKRFHSEPWVLLNEIIKETFDDKFYFTEPNVESESYSYKAVLVQRDTGAEVTVNTLSSGEKTLLWLALTLFNSQYYEQSVIKTPKLLLLDEPDAFLHPQMVVKMYRVLEAFSERFNSRICITSHSPTTVALAPDKSTYIVSDDSIIPVTKDEGVAELLDGVTQISINPENRRQVFYRKSI